MSVALLAAASILPMGPELPPLPPIRRDPQVTYVDRAGQVLAVRGGRFAPPVNLDRLPAHVPAAFVAIEDRRFYEHTGFDPRGIARAVITDLTEGRMKQGASTITQQLAKNLFLTSEQTAERKAKELLYAVQLERSYSKKQILGMYLSRVYFGSGAYGLEAASQRYFNKPASRLSIRETAILAGVLKSPNAYNPAVDTEAALTRSKLVLDAMLETGAITKAQHDKAASTTPKVWKTAPNGGAQYFVDWVDDQALRITGRVTQDLVVETTLDAGLEMAAADAARATVERFKGQRADQAAVVGIDGLGRVRVLVGGTDYTKAPFNRAVQARRQAGSAWKPFVYLTALEAGRLPDTPVVDEPVTINGWTPANYSNEFLGPITLETALAHSVNTVAARLADEVGRPNVAATAQRLGIVSPINVEPAMALGTTLVSPLELTQAYMPLSNGGYRLPAYGIERIRTAGGKVLYQRRAPQAVQVVANPPLSEMNRMMRTVMVSGTGVRAAPPGYDLAGKTGTTSDYKDAWFCGYTGGFASCAWMGRDDAQPMGRISGATAPAELWRAFMTPSLKKLPRMAIPTGPVAAIPPPPPPPPEDEASDVPPEQVPAQPN